jgi:hypothetical protein
MKYLAISLKQRPVGPVAEFLDEIQTEVSKRFPPCYSQPPLQLCLEISVSSNSRNLLLSTVLVTVYTVSEKGGKPDRKPYYLPYGLRNSYRKLKSENFQETLTKLYIPSSPQHCFPADLYTKIERRRDRLYSSMLFPS